MEHTKDYSKNTLKKIDEDLQDSDQAILKLKENTDVTAKTTGGTLEYGKSRWDYEKNEAWKEVRIITIGQSKIT